MTLIMGKKIIDPKVGAAFRVFAPDVRKKLMRLRALIFEVASETEGVGELEETLKWGQPSYLPRKPKTGSAVRLGREKKTEYYLGALAGIRCALKTAL